MHGKQEKIAHTMLQVLQIGMGWITQQPGGLNRYAFGLSNGLAGLGVDQKWLVAAREPVQADLKAFEVLAVTSPDASLLTRFRAFQSAFDALATGTGRPDAVASHFALYAFPLRRRLAQVPHVVQFHGPWAAETRAEGAARWKSWLQKRQEMAVYRTADRVITLSSAFADIAVRDYRVPQDIVRVIPGGVDVERFATGSGRDDARKKLGLPLDRPIGICVRRLARRMGLDVLLDATADVVKRHPDFLLLIGGKGRLHSELVAQIEQLGLQKNVRLLGYVSDEDLPSYYTASDFSIVPTQSLEGFGLIVLESLAAGTPVLVTPVGGLPEILRGFSPQMIMEDSSVAAIRDGILAILNGSLHLPTAKECYDYTDQNYRWEKIAAKVLQVYQEAIAAHG